LELAASLEEASGISPPPEEPAPPGFSAALPATKTNIIAEIKYRSPSHGPFRCRKPPDEIADSYVENGAAALSVLTDQTFFSGSLDHLARVRKRLIEQERSAKIPILRKDFILDRRQVVEACRFGASAYLLIAACLDVVQLRELIQCGEEQGIEPLVEVHDAWELERAIDSGAGIIGVNNRNLKTFEVDIRTSFELARMLEGESYLLVAESGISEPQQVRELQDAGFSAFLIGTAFMNSKNPGEELASLLAEVGGKESDGSRIYSE